MGAGLQRVLGASKAKPHPIPLGTDRPGVKLTTRRGAYSPAPLAIHSPFKSEEHDQRSGVRDRARPTSLPERRGQGRSPLSAH